MSTNKNRILEIIDAKRDTFIDVSDRVWEYAETRFEEHKSADIFCKVLEAEGFNVERGIADISTAFVGSFGSGKPVIAILAEYDALSGLSQKPRTDRKEAVIEGGNGHGCGHNLLGAGSLAAAVAVKDWVKKNNIQGTICLYGCPGEEGGSGKAFMAREGVFDDIDIALCWHPFAQNGIFSVGSLANFQVYYRFYGKSSHAAASPHLGRSALDAVELMNVGVNYLREHIIPEARIHYAVTNTGGISPNVVQAKAEVLYLIRAPKTSQVQEIFDRVNDIAKGAALMTQTKHEVVFDKACSNLIPNNTIEEILYENFMEVGPPRFDEDDKKYAKEISATLSDSDINNEMKMINMLTGERGKEIIKNMKEKELSDTILPFVHHGGMLSGSTDVGDVSWIVPTGQVITACCALGTPGHSWQMVAQGVTSIGHKGMLAAGKVLAMTALDILMNPEIVKMAKEELREKLNEKTYKSPIPSHIKPSVIK